MAVLPDAHFAHEVTTTAISSYFHLVIARMQRTLRHFRMFWQRPQMPRAIPRMANAGSSPLSKMDARMEKGFAAVAEDVGQSEKMATKDQMITLTVSQRDRNAMT